MKDSKPSKKYILEIVRKVKEKEEECLIIGNGPSLNGVSNEILSLLPSFGTNKIFKKFVPTFYVCINDNEINKNRLSIEQIDSKLKFTSSYNQVFGSYGLTPSTEVEFSLDPLKYVNQGHTVTYVCLQLAYWMGFKKVYLVGIDHFYTQKGDPDEEIIWKGLDLNHFKGAEVSDNDKWNCANLEASEHYFQIAKETYEEDGKSIINLTHNSCLKIFETNSIDILRK